MSHPESVFSGGAGVWGGQELVMGEEVLRSGLPDQGQPPEVLLHKGL